MLVVFVALGSVLISYFSAARGSHLEKDRFVSIHSAVNWGASCRGYTRLNRVPEINLTDRTKFY